MKVVDALQVILTFDTPGDVDVTSYVRSGSINRQRQIGGPTRAGQTEITLKNITRVFDPPWPGGTPGAYGNIRPGQRVQIFWDSEQVFDGHVDDWDHGWTRNGMPTATLKASDALGQLAQREFAEWLTTGGQRIHTRLTEAFARPEVDWTGTTDFDWGPILLQDDFLADGSPVLPYVHLLERTDGGRFFASRTNVLTYRSLNNATPAVTAVTFTDDTAVTSGVRGIFDIGVTYDSEEWYTQVNVTRDNGDIQTASSDPAITALHEGGYKPLDIEGLLMAIDAAAMNLAEYKLSVHEEVVPYVSSLRCRLDGLSDADGLAVAGLEIGDQVVTAWTPTGAGALVTQTLAVEGITDRFDRYGDFAYDRTVTLSRLIGLESWIIGTSQIGTGVLGI
jgi:hypothetical protein